MPDLSFINGGDRNGLVDGHAIPNGHSDRYSESFAYDIKAPHQIHVIVVGGGLGGLASAISCTLAGHKVTVLEAAVKLGEVRKPTFVRGKEALMKIITVMY